MALLIDTDVLIDYLRDDPQAVQFLEDDRREMLISAISVAELYAGVREGAEREALDIFLAAFDVVPVDSSIAERGGLYRRDYFRAHAVSLADALIAATASVRSATLVTLNHKHFPMISDIHIPYTKG
jgi:predicted nucleic acid-binding protein